MTSPTRGDFSFVAPEWEREMYQDAFQAVEATPGGWEFLAAESPPETKGFMFWSHPTLSAINRNMKYGGHSGSSHALVMRSMESIAKNGWVAWVVRMRR
jgi:hypothetical protein